MNVSILAHLCHFRHGLVQIDKRELSHVTMIFEAMIFEHSFVYSCKFVTGKGYEC